MPSYTESDKRAINSGIAQRIQQSLQNSRNRNVAEFAGKIKVDNFGMSEINQNYEQAIEQEETATAYLNALLKEVERRKNSRIRWDNMYVGPNISLVDTPLYLSDEELGNELDSTRDWVDWISSAKKAYTSVKKENTIDAPKCARTALTDQGIKGIGGNQYWAQVYKQYGYAKRPEGEAPEEGDLVQAYSGNTPFHMMTVDQAGDDMRYNYARGSGDEYVKHARANKINGETGRVFYHFVGTPADSLKWANDARVAQGLEPILKRGGILKRIK